MRSLLLAAVLILAGVTWTAAPAKPAGHQVIEPLNSKARWKKYCAGRPLYEHDWPSQKEWPSGMAVDKPYYFGRPTKTTLHAKNGRYRTLDGKVQCMVRGDKVACSNGGQIVECGPKGCRGGGPSFHPDPDVNVLWGFDTPKLQTILPASADFDTDGQGPLCRTYGSVVRCRKGPPDDAGFMIDAYFARVESYLNVADGWPWDGKCHNPFEME